MATINPYINFDGDCAAAFDFYKAAFGGEFVAKQKFGEVPGFDELPAAQKDRIMHVSLPIGPTAMLMGSDWSERFGPMIRGNAFAVTINTEDRAEAERLFNALSAGGTVSMPMTEAFWGAYFGMFMDKFNINWMVNCEKKKS
jgi:PhnB protein